MENAEEYVTIPGQDQKQMSKIVKYNWTVQDSEPEEFLYIDKNDLQVDHRYQRDNSEAKTRAIASKWSWIACGCIIVARRNDGFFVIDGQHRVAAARKRTDVKRMPCLVFSTKDMIEEAQAFLTIQTQRKAVTAIQKFNALLAVRDPAAILVDMLVKQSGRTIRDSDSSASTVKCVGVLLQHAKVSPEILTDLWPLIISASAGQPIREPFVQGLMYMETQLRRCDQTILSRNWSQRILKIGSDTLNKAAMGAAAYHKRGGSKIWASGICKEINWGLRNKLRYPGSSEIE